jgi:hypothetical protein
VINLYTLQAAFNDRTQVFITYCLKVCKGKSEPCMKQTKIISCANLLASAAVKYTDWSSWYKPCCSINLDYNMICFFVNVSKLLFT